MQVIEIIYDLTRVSRDGVQDHILSTRLSYLEILHKLSQGLVSDTSYSWLVGQLKPWWETSEAIPAIVVRGDNSSLSPEDTVELWWNGGILECYRLQELATMFKQM